MSDDGGKEREPIDHEAREQIKQVANEVRQIERSLILLEERMQTHAEINRSRDEELTRAIGRLFTRMDESDKETNKFRQNHAVQSGVISGRFQVLGILAAVLFSALGALVTIVWGLVGPGGGS